MGNKNSTDGNSSVTNDNNNNNVNNKRNSQTFKPLKARASATDKFTLKLHPEEIISLYETAQDNLKTKMKTLVTYNFGLSNKNENEDSIQ